MDLIARLAGEHYDAELRGGEGHMEVGKAIQSFTQEKAHMVVSVKPWGCMPSSGVSDGIQSAVMSRILMCLFKARRRARSEFEQALDEWDLSLAAARRALDSKQRSALHQPAHHCAGTGANLAMSL